MKKGSVIIFYVVLQIYSAKVWQWNVSFSVLFLSFSVGANELPACLLEGTVAVLWPLSRLDKLQLSVESTRNLAAQDVELVILVVGKLEHPRVENSLGQIVKMLHRHTIEALEGCGAAEFSVLLNIQGRHV